MWDFVRVLLIYVFGGVTFIPFTILAIFLHGFLTLPRVSPPVEDRTPDLLDPADDDHNIRIGSDAADARLQKGQEKEYAGYYAVTREWIPGGVSGKPPEKTVPAGDVVGEESPSVYQSMYRSLFDRKHGPTMEVGKSNGRALRKPNNIFYVVLRHGHLMLYDDSEQIEVRYVISLAQHDVTVYGGDAEIPEGELWIKRNAIRLSRRPGLADSLDLVSKPFFLFSDNCSEKEDFYFALLQNQERKGNDENPPPLVQHYETKHIIGLVQRLHSSEEHLQTRWFNALLGRLFLSLYKTQDLENFVRTKITKKIARVKKPGFLSGIVLQKIDLGNAAPFITNPRLRDLTVDGDCCAEADVKYEGKFRVEIAATVRIELGSRFKAREVNVVLAITLKKLEGRMLVKFKPCPSNRLWFSFNKMPQLDLQIEPIVSSRQITYNIILRAIESRIREVFAETLVAPHWDDIPFTSTLDQFFRGGIWINERRDFQPPTETIVPDDEHGEGDEKSLKIPGTPTLEDEKIQNPPVSVDGQRQRFFSRKGMKSTPTLPTDHDSGSTSSFQKSPDPPTPMKSKPFSAAAGPIVSTDNVNRDVARSTVKRKASKDAASIMSELSYRSQPSSPSVVPPTPIDDENTTSIGSAPKQASGSRPSSIRSSDGQLESPSFESKGAEAATHANSKLEPHSPSASHNGLPPSKLQSLARTLTPSEKKQQALGSAALAAKNWGWKTLSKTKAQPASISSNERLGTPENPIGRGQPLPPPGQPLPHPEKRRSGSFQMPPRKNIPAKLADVPGMEIKRDSDGASRGSTPPLSAASAPPPTAREKPISPPAVREIPPTPTAGSEATPPPLPARNLKPEDVFVVAAPMDSEPESSGEAEAGEDEYGEFMHNVESTEEEGGSMEHRYAEGITSEPTEEDEEGHSGIHAGEEHHSTADEHGEHSMESTTDVHAVPSEQKFLAEEDAPAALEENRPSTQHPAPLTPANDDESGLEPWNVAEEEEARSKSVWIDEGEMP